MRKLLFAELAFSTLIIALPAAAQGTHAWCTTESARGTSFHCFWDTWDQCRQSMVHLMGGSCLRNPAYRGPEASVAQVAPGASVRRTRAKSDAHATFNGRSRGVPADSGDIYGSASGERLFYPNPDRDFFCNRYRVWLYWRECRSFRSM
jgi:hypothetical protein